MTETKARAGEALPAAQNSGQTTAAYPAAEMKSAMTGF